MILFLFFLFTFQSKLIDVLSPRNEIKYTATDEQLSNSTFLNSFVASTNNTNTQVYLVDTGDDLVYLDFVLTSYDYEYFKDTKGFFIADFFWFTNTAIDNGYGFFFGIGWTTLDSSKLRGDYYICSIIGLFKHCADYNIALDQTEHSLKTILINNANDLAKDQHLGGQDNCLNITFDKIVYNQIGSFKNMLNVKLIRKIKAEESLDLDFRLNGNFTAFFGDLSIESERDFDIRQLKVGV